MIDRPEHEHPESAASEPNAALPLGLPTWATLDAAPHHATDATGAGNEEDLPEVPDAPPWVEEHQGQAPVKKREAFRTHHIIIATFAALVAVMLVLILAGRMTTLAQNFMQKLSPAEEAVEATPVVAAKQELRQTFTFADLELHPDLLYQPYLSAPVLTADATSPNLVKQFRTFLAMYEVRQKEDDNFTIRVIDDRTGETLERYVLEADRQTFEQEGKANWGHIDGKRRAATNQLLNKYVSKGIPKSAVTIKWGRANQIREARVRDEPFIEYEVRLARYLGLSLLATEIGTVETFNQDELVSSVGARSRYQMMPYVLRQQGVHHYDLTTASGKRISVFEEWHPLLTMEPALTFLKGYVNAVGHEIPGISAYHTGPGNIFEVYRLFLTQGAPLVQPNATVMDAYMWAVTEGYPKVSNGSSFKSYSRAYVASGYGALKATENLRIDRSQTIRAERVQLKSGRSAHLSELLRVLDATDVPLNWGPHEEAEGIYERFRALNPHIQLPEGSTGALVPVAGDVRFVAEKDGAPVKFFLPIGASEALRQGGVNVLDESATFIFDEDTYAPPRSEVTEWDRQYADLVDRSKTFGFTAANRQELFAIADRFAQLYAENPTAYRRHQRDVIQMHESVWRTGAWEKLASATAAARGALRAPTLPPEQVRTTPNLPDVNTSP